MSYILISIGFIAMITLFGVGLAYWICPRILRPYSWILSPWIGYSYLIFTGWYCYRLDFPGVNSYIWYLLLPPIAALIAMVMKARVWERWKQLISREVLLLLGLCALLFLFVSLPYLEQTEAVTAVSTFNNDIADTDSVASFLLQCKRSETLGFMGQGQHIFQQLADTVIFGGPFSVAAGASLLSVETYQLQNISIHVFFIFGVLVFYALAHKVYKYSRLAALGMLALYGFSPILYYTMYNTFQAQIITMGLTLCIYLLLFVMMQNCRNWKEVAAYLPMLVLFNWGITYTYPHMLPLIYLPMFLYLAMQALVNRKWQATGMAAVIIGSSLMLMFMLYPARVSELIQMVLVRQQAIAGWFMYFITPDTLSGLTLKFTSLDPHPPWTRTVLTLIMMGLLLWGMKSTYRKDSSVFTLSTTILVAVMIGYLVLSYTGRGEDGWGGYKSYKLISFFLPFYLLAVGLFFREFKFPLGNKKNIVVGICLALLLVVNIYSAHRMTRKMTKHHRIVTKEMIALKKIGDIPGVESINILGKDCWSILWEANFLMRKKLYFETSTYAGRAASELKGEWDLMKYQEEQTELEASETVIPVNKIYYLKKHELMEKF